MTVLSSEQIKEYIIKAVDSRLSLAISDLRLARIQQRRMPFDHDNNDFVSRKSLEVAVGEAALRKVRELL